MGDTLTLNVDLANPGIPEATLEFRKGDNVVNASEPRVTITGMTPSLHTHTHTHTHTHMHTYLQMHIHVHVQDVCNTHSTYTNSYYVLHTHTHTHAHTPLPSTHTDTQLTITNVNSDDRGRYTAVATNKVEGEIVGQDDAEIDIKVKCKTNRGYYQLEVM